MVEKVHPEALWVLSLKEQGEKQFPECGRGQPGDSPSAHLTPAGANRPGTLPISIQETHLLGEVGRKVCGEDVAQSREAGWFWPSRIRFPGLCCNSLEASL